MKYKNTIFIFIVIYFAFAFNAVSDDSVKKRFGIGIIGGGSFVMNNTSLRILPEYDDFENFENGTDFSFFAGIDASYEIMDDFLFASARLLYDSRPVTLSKETSRFMAYYPPEDTELILYRLFEYDGTLNYLDLDIGVKIKPLKQYPLFARLSFDVGYTIFGTDYTNHETIKSHDGVTYPELTRKRLVNSGAIDDLTLAMGASLGISAEFQVLQDFMDDLYLSPEVSFRYGINSIHNTSEWKVNIVRAGVSLQWKFSLEKQEEELPPDTIATPPPDTATYIPPLITDKKHCRLDGIPVYLDETIVTQTYPLLPYIFYDSASYKLKEKYKTDVNVAEFTEEGLPKSTLNIYYHLPDIIAYRLKQNPEAILIVKGVTDGEEIESDSARLILARKRAQAFVDYVSQKWGLDKSHFVVRAADMPDLPTNQMYKEGYEENRRIELFSNDSKILAPVVHSRFNEYFSNKNIFEIFIKPDTSRQVAQWKLSLYYKNETLFQRNGFGTPPEKLQLPYSYDFLLYLGNKVNLSDSLLIALSVEDNKGRKDTVRAFLKVSKSPNNYEIGRLNLIVFDFDKAFISNMNRTMIKEFIENSIHETSTTKITGSTDILGTKEYNKKLSYDRAISVKEYLNILKPDIEINDVKGIGDTKLQYDNSLPEGRFYCRTVLIEVKTPVNK